MSSDFESREPSHADPASYGIDPKTGIFRHPAAAPLTVGPRPVPQSLDHLEDRQYISNMTIEAHWPIVVAPGVSHHNFVDRGGRRFLYHYAGKRLNVYDITEPKSLKVLLEKQEEGPGVFGSAAIAFHERLGKWLMIQAVEVPRGVRVMGAGKYKDPEKAKEYLVRPGFRGFKVFEMTSPTEWTLMAEVSTDALNPKAAIQQGSGAVGAPTYFGGKYMMLATAPDNTFLRMEYPSYMYSAGHQVYDMENPADPRLVGSWWAPGQRLGEEDAYRDWLQCGNRTSWTGARMAALLPRPIEAGGKYAYTAMGGLGFFVLDVSDPRKIAVVGHLQLPLNVGGVEGDNVDVSRVEERGIALVNGYPMNEDGYEPYKDIYIVDVRDPTKPHIVGTLPRPSPPDDAPYSDFVLRGGRFGPKRHGFYQQPGKPRPDIAVYAFNNAGVQVFDIADPAASKRIAYFVPRMTDELDNPRSYTNPIEVIGIEWDRNLVWAFANSGIYLLSSPAIGNPKFDL